VIAADERPLALLKEEFSQCETVRLPGMGVSYPRYVSMSVFMALKAPRFFKAIQEENENLEHIIRNYKIDGVISDNRYGMNHEKIPSVLITHQLFIQAPIFKRLLKRITANYIENFDECWIPDFRGKDNLSGELSHQSSSLNNLRFIGPLSRFMGNNAQTDLNQNFRRKLMVILSGPEPSRTSCEKRLFKQLEGVDFEVLFVRGLVGSSTHTDVFHHGKVEIKSHLPTEEMREEILQSEVVLSRCGYSSVMDLAVLGKKAILIPTKGQTEQEYLAKHLRSKSWFFTTTENKLKLLRDLERAKSFPGLKVDLSSDQLEKAVGDFLSRID
jgi:UDP-N-acetylglucosamine transferase subunit ALG13